MIRSHRARRLGGARKPQGPEPVPARPVDWHLRGSHAAPGQGRREDSAHTLQAFPRGPSAPHGCRNVP